MRDLPERFWEKVERITECGCWIWMGAVTHAHSGLYGRFLFEGKSRKAHRVAYQHLVGPIPDGLHLDHICRVTCCVNPAHLEPVTNAENVLRGWKARGKNTRCINGHLIDGVSNWRWGTTCRACRMQYEADPQRRLKKNLKARALYWERKNNVA